MASPAQMDRDRQQLNFSMRPRVDSFNIPSSKKTNDSASFANYMPPKKTNDSASFANYLPPVDNSNNNNNSGIEAFNFEGTQYLNVSDPMITANAPTLAQLMGDIGGGIGDMMGAGADFILGGGTMGRVLGGLKDKFAQGKNFVGDMMNPGNINERVNALSPEQRRIYTMYMSQGMPYQQAFEQASGQAFAKGGITSLN